MAVSSWLQEKSAGHAYPYDYGVEIGVGCDLYLPYFTLSPELKFCFGLNQMVKANQSKYSQSLAGATHRMIILSFNFE